VEGANLEGDTGRVGGEVPEKSDSSSTREALSKGGGAFARQGQKKEGNRLALFDARARVNRRYRFPSRTRA
jgi:hypothetical protein